MGVNMSNPLSTLA